MLVILRMENKKTEQHPLNDQWSWWEHRKANSEEDYSNNTVRCADFETVEGFWQCMNNIPSPSEFFYNGHNNRRICWSLLADSISYEIKKKNNKDGCQPKPSEYIRSVDKNKVIHFGNVMARRH